MNFLSISNSNINKGLEHLPDNLEKFYCESTNSSFKVKEIEDKLKSYSFSDEKYNSYDGIGWKKYWIRYMDERNKLKINFNDINLFQSATKIEPKFHEKIGAGAYGVVYKRTWNNKAVGLKRFGLSFKKYSTEVRKGIVKVIETEIALMKKLDNPYIVKYYDFFNDITFIVEGWSRIIIIMELVEYKPLNNFIINSKRKSHNWALNYRSRSDLNETHEENSETKLSIQIR